jgi:archaellum biogenesis ATPase FlaH
MERYRKDPEYRAKITFEYNRYNIICLIKSVKEWNNLTINCDINDTLYHMNKAKYGAHYIIIYPNLDTMRQLYASYINKQIQENNEIVLVNPFYETTESIRQLLSQRNPDLDVPKHEKEKSLIIIDSLEEYFGKPSDGMLFKRSLAKYAKKIGKNGLSILGDIGAYPYKSRSEDLVDYESSLPAKFDLSMKGFCLYHQKDFDTFSREQKQKLIEHHGKVLNIIEKEAVDSAFFKRPLNYVDHIKEFQHIVLFYEEIEYGRVISFQFIKSGLEDKKMCSYLSDEDLETVRREMADNRIDVNKFTMNGLLHIYQFPCKTNYHTRNIHIKEHGLANMISNFIRPGPGDRIVFKRHKINTEEQIKSNLKWEREYRLKELKNRATSILCTYPVENIIPELSDSRGAHAKWMSDLLDMYDGVIFARRFWKGVAFNLD